MRDGAEDPPGRRSAHTSPASRAMPRRRAAVQAARRRASSASSISTSTLRASASMRMRRVPDQRSGPPIAGFRRDVPDANGRASAGSVRRSLQRDFSPICWP